MVWHGMMSYDMVYSAVLSAALEKVVEVRCESATTEDGPREADSENSELVSLSELDEEAVTVVRVTPAANGHRHPGGGGLVTVERTRLDRTVEAHLACVEQRRYTSVVDARTYSLRPSVMLAWQYIYVDHGSAFFTTPCLLTRPLCGVDSHSPQRSCEIVILCQDGGAEGDRAVAAGGISPTD